MDTIEDTKVAITPEKWMTALYDDYLKDRTLHEITLPGTHDAGCYTGNKDGPYDGLSITQVENISQQLHGGVRYFDLRPQNRPFTEGYWTYHGPTYNGDRLDGKGGILDQISTFMDALGDNSRELVILNISHFSNFSPFTGEHHTPFIKLVRDTLGHHLVCHSQKEINLFDCSYSKLLSSKDLTQQKSGVVILYDGALDTDVESYVTNHALPDGFFTICPKYDVEDFAKIYLFDQYFGATDVSKLRVDQCGKLLNRNAFPFVEKGTTLWKKNCMGGCSKVMHLFSWTLTPQKEFGKPWEYAQNFANGELLNVLKAKSWKDESSYDPTKHEKINIVYVDNYASHKTQNDNVIGNKILLAKTALPVAIAVKLNGYGKEGFSWEKFG